MEFEYQLSFKFSLERCSSICLGNRVFGRLLI